MQEHEARDDGSLGLTEEADEADQDACDSVHLAWLFRWGVVVFGCVDFLKINLRSSILTSMLL